MTADLANGLFEFGGAALLLLNIRALLRDRRVHGVSLVPALFYTGWGIWNLYYYPHLGQVASFVGGCFVVAVNAVWLILAIHFRRAS